ncbi:MAG: hypothetical protein ABJN26_08695 [Stappiaceae bacterium]
MIRSILFTISALFTFAAGSFAAFSQAPTHAQQQAIRSNCVADYRANCSSVPTGGMDALICLEQHEAKLSPACKSAVEAVDRGSKDAAPATKAAAPADAAKPATATPTPSTETTATAPTEKPATTAKQPPEAKPAHHGNAPQPALSLRQEIRIAAGSCARDYRLLCPGLPIGQGHVLFCLKVHAQRLDRICKTALEEAGVIF